MVETDFVILNTASDPSAMLSAGSEETPVFNANKIQDVKVSRTPPLNSQALVYDEKEEEYTPAVFTTVQTFTNIIQLSNSSLQVAGQYSHVIKYNGFTRIEYFIRFNLLANTTTTNLIFNTNSYNPLYNHSPDALKKLKWNQLVGK